jgi:hypothetical protein
MPDINFYIFQLIFKLMSLSTNRNRMWAFVAGSLMCIAQPAVAQKPKRPSYSGIYPHLAMYNNEGECGTGAVVPWAGKLWAITYGPHLPLGSSDKLYEIGNDLKQTVRPESIGGTPANRMIHRESNQLFIGPYAIDSKGGVRTIPYQKMPGRHTGNARHLTDPAGKILYGTMEEGFYEVDVKTLAPKMLYEDGNVDRNKVCSRAHTGKAFIPARGWRCIPITASRAGRLKYSLISNRARCRNGMGRTGRWSAATSLWK